MKKYLSDIVYIIALVTLGTHRIHQEDYVGVFIISNMILLTVAHLFYRLSIQNRNRSSDMDNSVSRIFHYSFDPIGWEYDNLSVPEKKALTRNEFELIKSKYKK